MNAYRALRFSYLVGSSAALFVVLSASHARCDVRLPAIFSDHMVLQGDAAVPVWGWAEPGEEISVDFAGQSKSTKAAADGKWKVRLDELKASDRPQTLT